MVHKARNMLDWFRDAKLGLFVHWGLYALPAGEWKGVETPSVSEWLMKKFRIPAREYAELAKSFAPSSFDADAWAGSAKDAGLKYLVVTAKHHDGFAMYHSKCDPFNIVDATPFGRDPLQELAAACAKVGVRLGFYYSQDQDWSHPGGSGNRWDYPGRTDADFATYLERKVKPQLTELLTNYGAISTIWFDTPETIKPEQSLMLREHVRSLQPACLVSGRIGHGLGDYESLGDNEVPGKRLDTASEGIATMNESWGYKALDNDWKSPAEIINILIDTVACDANFMLNVGPDALGRFPAPCLDILKALGAWLEVNGTAIYGAEEFPPLLECSYRHAKVTGRRGTMYLLMRRQPRNGKLVHYGTRNQVIRARLLSQPEAPVEFRETHRNSPDFHRHEFQLPSVLDWTMPQVLEVQLQGPLSVAEKIYNSGCHGDLFTR